MDKEILTFDDTEIKKKNTTIKAQFLEDLDIGK